MSLWSGASGQVNATNLEKLGPWFDCVVGTDGRYTDLKAAIDAGFYKIVIIGGATLSADLTIPSAAANGFIWSPHQPGGGPNLGAKAIELQASNFMLAGFELNGGGSKAGAGLTISGTVGNTHIERMGFNDFLGAGIAFTTTGNGHVITACSILDNGGDGIITSSGASAIFIVGGNTIYGNGDYGVDDTGADYSVIMGNRIANNTSGQINAGTDTIHTDMNQLV